MCHICHFYCQIGHYPIPKEQSYLVAWSYLKLNVQKWSCSLLPKQLLLEKDTSPPVSMDHHWLSLLTYSLSSQSISLGSPSEQLEYFLSSSSCLHGHCLSSGPYDFTLMPLRPLYYPPHPPLTTPASPTPGLHQHPILLSPAPGHRYESLYQGHRSGVRTKVALEADGAPR